MWTNEFTTRITSINLDEKKHSMSVREDVLRVENQKHVRNDKRKHADIHHNSKIWSSKLREGDGETI